MRKLKKRKSGVDECEVAYSENLRLRNWNWDGWGLRLGRTAEECDSAFIISTDQKTERSVVVRRRRRFAVAVVERDEFPDEGKLVGGVWGRLNEWGSIYY